MIGVAIDPGLRGCGVALFDLDQKILVHACYVRNPTNRGNDFEAGRTMANEIACDVHQITPYTINLVWAEVPISYKAGAQKGDQNDLIALAGFVYMILGADIFRMAKLVRYYPREWKGTLEKGETKIGPEGEISSTAFAGRIMDRLSVEEEDRIITAGELTHNIIDAIGIGLKGLGRLEPRHVYGVIE